MTGLERLNAVPDGEARQTLRGICASTAWVDIVSAGRPFTTPNDLYSAADAALAKIDEAALDEALAGHPRIGERSGSATSRREQAGVADETRTALAEANAEYEERFGHVYLVCASGRSGDELLALLRQRLANDPETERRVAREELGQINRLRLERLVEEP